MPYPARSRRIPETLAAALSALALIGCSDDAGDYTASGSAPAAARPAPRALPPLFKPKGPAPAIVGKSAIVLDARSGKVLYQKNADLQRPVASTQKLLTAMVIIDSGGLGERVSVASSDTWVEPTKLYLKPGQSYRKSDLVAALLVRSGNDVARCLARNHSGSEEAFALAMNAKARRLGMFSSNFKNPHGLTSGGQYSTARDMGKLGLAAYRSRTVRSITSIKQLPFRFADGRVVTYSNTNKVLHRSPYCNGLKTGYTRASGRCLISSGKNGSREVVVVVLGSTTASIWNDSQKMLHWALGVTS